jgi:AcrR family transcriptional regulator
VFAERQSRLRVLDVLEQRAKQFRSRDDSWPFRMPHEPLDLRQLIEDALGEGAAPLRPEALRTRSVLRLEWDDGGVWEVWAVTLPSGLHVYCDGDRHETRVLASARRGNPGDADGFLLERLAESRGHLFGIEMDGAPPARVKTSIGDRAFLADVFVELFEGTAAEAALGEARRSAAGGDFRNLVVGWLERVLSAPPMTRRQPRVRDEDVTAP